MDRDILDIPQPQLLHRTRHSRADFRRTKQINDEVNPPRISRPDCAVATVTLCPLTASSFLLLSFTAQK